VGCKGGAEIAIEIQAERNSPGVGPGTNCRGSVGNKGGFPKHLARCCTDLSRFVPPVSDPSALNFSQFVGYDQIPEFPGMDLKRESCRNVRIWRKSTAVQRKEPLFSERAMGISKLERVLEWTQSSQQILDYLLRSNKSNINQNRSVSHCWTATDARPGLPQVVRAINVANFFKISTCSWLLWGPPVISP